MVLKNINNNLDKNTNFLKENSENLNTVNLQSDIFFKNINNNKYKLVPFNIKENYVGENKYSPAASKEWKNNVYFYYNKNMKNLPVYNIYIYKLLKHYFNMFFKNRIILKKHISWKRRNWSLNRIFLSRPEVQHTSSKAIITIYVYNRENISFLKKINKLKILKKIKKLFYLLKNKNNLKNKKNIFISYIYPLFIKGESAYNNMYYSFYFKAFLSLLYKEIIIIRGIKLNLNLNKYKFNNILLYKIGKLISRFYNKNIEFNIINLQSIVLNPDIFTELLRLKLRKRKIRNVTRMMYFILGKVKLPKVNRIIERGRLIKSINFNLLENKYKNININSIINNNLDNIIKGLSNNTYFRKKVSLSLKYFFLKKKNAFLKENSFFRKKFLLKKNIIIKLIKYYIFLRKNIFLSEKILFKKKTIFLNKKKTIFNGIKYKNIGGIRLEIKGRLTKRYRADRAIYKVRWKGGLKNIDSAFKGLSAVNFRGYANSNVEYSIRTYKRYIGAFAVKGWISGK